MGDLAARLERHQRYAASAELAARLALPPAVASCAYCGQRWDDQAGGCDAAAAFASLEQEQKRSADQIWQLIQDLEFTRQARQAAEQRAERLAAALERIATEHTGSTDPPLQCCTQAEIARQALAEEQDG